MSQTGLKARQEKCYYHFCKGLIRKIAPSVIDRDFLQKDQTEMGYGCVTGLHKGWLYIYLILDMYNGEIIIYTLSRNSSLKMVTDMLKKAFNLRGTRNLMVGCGTQIKYGIISIHYIKRCWRIMVSYKICPAKEIVWVTLWWRISSVWWRMNYCM